MNGDRCLEIKSITYHFLPLSSSPCDDVIRSSSASTSELLSLLNCSVLFVFVLQNGGLRTDEALDPFTAGISVLAVKSFSARHDGDKFMFTSEESISLSFGFCRWYCWLQPCKMSTEFNFLLIELLSFSRTSEDTLEMAENVLGRSLLCSSSKKLGEVFFSVSFYEQQMKYN